LIAFNVSSSPSSRPDQIGAVVENAGRFAPVEIAEDREIADDVAGLTLTDTDLSGGLISRIMTT
jgi:hypothetical protein